MTYKWVQAIISSANKCAAHSETDLVILADGEVLDVVLGLEVLVQGCAHLDVANARGSSEVGLAVLAAAGRHVLVELHLRCSGE